LNKFTLIISSKAAKDLDNFSDTICMKIVQAINILEKNPFPKGKLIRKIKGKHSDFYRLRIDKYRVFFMIETDKVVILRIINKKDADKLIQQLDWLKIK
jgi:mRNA-degrading endonuclease RelE of RelBE toxin-antitoxin system